MYSRKLQLPLDHNDSIFLFGPRGTGKTYWLKATLPDCVTINLLTYSVYQKLSSRPDSLSDFIPPNYRDWVIIDEIQRVPELLNEVHDQIESLGRKFILTGSSARSLRRQGVNLLAGRALRYHMHPLTVEEIASDFDLQYVLKYGLLPKAQLSQNPEIYLKTYLQNYIREEVFQEALVRNLASFSRFIEVASFSQGEMLNLSSVAQDTGISRQAVSNYFDILEDLLLAVRIPAFTRRAKRIVKTHAKFFYFDVGVYRTIRPSGYLDTPEEADGAGLETLFLQSVRAVNDYYQLDYTIHFWHTKTGLEVDFVLYGPNGLFAVEIKRARSIKNNMLRGLKAFQKDYPEAQCYLAYTGNETLYQHNVTILPILELLKQLPIILKGI